MDRNGLGRKSELEAEWGKGDRRKWEGNQTWTRAWVIYRNGFEQKL